MTPPLKLVRINPAPDTQAMAWTRAVLQWHVMMWRFYAVGCSTMAVAIERQLDMIRR